MATRLRRLYWDSGCVIGLLSKQSTVPKEWLDAIEAAYDDMLCDKVKIVINDELFKVEVFAGKSKREQATYNTLVGCRNFELVTTPMSSYTAEVRKLREDFQAIKQSIQVCDAMHVLCAKRGAVDEFWTTDGAIVRKAPTGLFGNLKVCHPYLEQLRLF